MIAALVFLIIGMLPAYWLGRSGRLVMGYFAGFVAAVASTLCLFIALGLYVGNAPPPGFMFAPGAMGALLGPAIGLAIGRRTKAKAG